MKAWKLALVIWLPVLVIALVAGGIYLHVHHDNHVKAQQAQAAAEQKAAAEQAVQSCQAQIHERWDPVIQSGKSLGLPTYGDLATEQSQLNQCKICLVGGYRYPHWRDAIYKLPVTPGTFIICWRRQVCKLADGTILGV